MNKKQSFYISVIFIAGGILSGICALIISAIMPESFQQQLSFGPILVFVTIEELAKLLANLLIIKSFMLQKLLSAGDIIFNATLGGFGFGLFEFFLITLDSSISPNALNPMMIHIVTGFVLGLAIALHLRKINILALAVATLSVVVHLCYNMFVVNNNF